MISRKFYLSRTALLTVLSAWVLCPAAAAQPQVLNHQGRIAVQGLNFEGNGQFKFALVNANGTVTYWSNNGSSVAGAEPTAVVTLAVSRGLYAVQLGNLALPNMTSIPPSALEYEDVRLRVWFNDGVRGFQQISPDQPLAAVPYAIHARKALAADTFGGLLAGEVTGAQSATAIADVTVTGKRLTGFAAATGALTSADSILSAIGKLHGNSALQAPLASPTFTGTVAGITASMVGLGNVTNTSDANKPVSTAQQTALDFKAPLASPTFTGTVGGITATMVGLGNVTNTSDANKPVSAAQQTALDFKAPLASPAFTGTVSGITATMVGLGNVANTSDASKPVSTAQQTALDLKANLASPQFTGTVRLPAGSTSAAPMRFALGTNLTTAVFGAVEFDGTHLYLTNNSATPTRKTIAFTDSVIASGAVGSSQLAAGLTLGGTTTGSFSGPLTGNATTATSATSFTGSLAGDVTGTQSATSIAAATVTGKALTGYVSGPGIVTATDTLLSAINKLNGNDGSKANLASPTFTGTVAGITASMVGLGNVTNTSDASKPVSTAQQTALDSKAPLASPTFTGTVGGITASMVGLANVTNTSDANKPVSTAQQNALNSKANLASPTFTGTVAGITASMVGLGNVTNTADADKPVSAAQQTALSLKSNLASPSFTGTVTLPAGSVSAAPLRLATGTNLTAAVFGAVEFDGTKLYLTTNSASPTRKTLAFTDDLGGEVSLSSITAAPVKPVIGWGDNGSGQTSIPTLANVAAVAAGEAHSTALLDDGTVVAWGLNGSGQTSVPAGLGGVTQISAGANFNLVRKNDGTVSAWGANDFGQTTLPSGITTASQVAAGEKHGLALLANGSVRAWGDNTFGQTTLPTLSGVTAIAAGYDHSLALKSDGTVVAWGRDDAGQVTLPAGLSGVTAIAAGAYHSLALKSDGTLVAWGWDGGGQVTLPAGLTNVVKIAGGYAFSMALKADGSVVVWGDNSSSQTTVPSSASLVTHIAAGASHALALRADAIPAQVARLDQDNVFTGKVGIARTPAANALEVAGNASKSTAGSWLANSDRRIKSEIRPILGALEKLDQVRLVDFRYTEAYRATHPVIEDRRYPNVIAQEFAEVFPDDVKGSGERLPDGSEIQQVDTYPLTIYTAAAVQELHRENQALKQQISAQELRLRKLEAVLEK